MRGVLKAKAKGLARARAIYKMKLYLRIIYGWLKKDSTGIEELENALTDSLKPFGFEHTGSRIDSVSGVKDLSFEADKFRIPEGGQ